MEHSEMIALVQKHMDAEGAGDVEGAVAVYTEDVVHDEVGVPGSPRIGKEQARDFYRMITSQFRAEKEEELHRFFDGDTMVLEIMMTGKAIGDLFGVPGNGRQLSFRMLHVFDFRDGLISREQVWVDGGSVLAQLNAS
jgi:steroid delta-isomerase-like uncharacterized protein